MQRQASRRPHRNVAHDNGQKSLPWTYLLVVALCGCLLAAGFFLAARQHFGSMEMGMKNSKLRKQLEELESENRRLVLAREIAMSPAEMTRIAKNMGFVTVGFGEPATANSNLPQRLAKLDKPLAENEIKPVAASVTLTSYAKPVKSEPEKTPDKKSDGAKESVGKTSEKTKTVSTEKESKAQKNSKPSSPAKPKTVAKN